jgi:hypothetical protein
VPNLSPWRKSGIIPRKIGMRRWLTHWGHFCGDRIDDYGVDPGFCHRQRDANGSAQPSSIGRFLSLGVPPSHRNPTQAERSRSQRCCILLIVKLANLVQNSGRKTDKIRVKPRPAVVWAGWRFYRILDQQTLCRSIGLLCPWRWRLS